jgi:hypothetical protein
VTTLPLKQDFTVYGGDGASYLFTFLDQSSAPFPLDGTWIAQVRDKPSPLGAVICNFEIDDTERLNGKLYLSLSSESTSRIAAVGRVFWDLEQTIPDSQPRTWYSGMIWGKAGISRVEPVPTRTRQVPPRFRSA